MFPPQQPGAGTSGPQQTAMMTPPPMTGSPMILPGKPPTFSDAQLIDKFTRHWKKESFDQRQVFERQWMRAIWYLLDRQWIYWDSKKGQWQDKRFAKWVPRPVTNILKDGLKTVRANFASINYGTTARPASEDNLSVVTASVADDWIPMLQEDYKMTDVMDEHDFWLLACGNVWLHTAVDYQRKNGVAKIQFEQCLACQQISSELDIQAAGQKCPHCGAVDFQPATHDDGSPMVESRVLPKGVTMALSPFEIAYPLTYERYDDAPYTIRIRWRQKEYYEQHPELRGLVSTLNFSKSPQERTMQIFKTLPYQSEMGMPTPFFGAGGGSAEAEGIVEYDVWIKPNEDFPDGQVVRFAGDSDTVVIHSEKEGLPGPLPYHDGSGNPIFTFHHSRYEHVGGRSLGSSLLDPAYHKQDQLNRIDSHMEMILGRMANPIWLEPKGAEVEKFTGEPGLVVKWNPLVGGATGAKPERIPGEGIQPSSFQYRVVIKEEAQDLMGTYDIMKGERPANVEAFATMQLLLERGQAKHASAFKSRAKTVKETVSDQLCIEQEFGEETRTRARMGPNRAWSFKQFQTADLKGTIEIVLEDGTQTPKTNLGERAAIDHLATLGMIDPLDMEMKRKVFEKFGQSSLLRETDAQIQEAWMNMDKLEKFLNDPMAVEEAAMDAQTNPDPNFMPGPLKFKRWYDPVIHRRELINWALSDRGRAVFEKSPAAEQYVEVYLMQIDMAQAQLAMGIVDIGGVQISTQPEPAPGPGGKAPGGSGTAMRNSAQNAAGVGKNSSGPGKTAQPQQ